MKIKVTDVNFQRNGVCGEGFFMLNFIYKEYSDQPAKDYTCVIFPEYDSETGEIIEEMNPKIAIMSKDDGGVIEFDNDWRGDNFQSVILKALRGYENDDLRDYSGNPFDGAIGTWEV